MASAIMQWTRVRSFHQLDHKDRFYVKPDGTVYFRHHGSAKEWHPHRDNDQALMVLLKVLAYANPEDEIAFRQMGNKFEIGFRDTTTLEPCEKLTADTLPLAICRFAEKYIIPF